MEFAAENSTFAKLVRPIHMHLEWCNHHTRPCHVVVVFEIHVGGPMGPVLLVPGKVMTVVQVLQGQCFLSFNLEGADWDQLYWLSTAAAEAVMMPSANTITDVLAEEAVAFQEAFSIMESAGFGDGRDDQALPLESSSPVAIQEQPRISSRWRHAELRKLRQPLPTTGHKLRNVFGGGLSKIPAGLKVQVLGCKDFPDWVLYSANAKNQLPEAPRAGVVFAMKRDELDEVSELLEDQSEAPGLAEVEVETNLHMLQTLATPSEAPKSKKAGKRKMEEEQDKPSAKRTRQFQDTTVPQSRASLGGQQVTFPPVGGMPSHQAALASLPRGFAMTSRQNTLDMPPIGLPPSFGPSGDQSFAQPPPSHPSLRSRRRNPMLAGSHTQGAEQSGATGGSRTGERLVWPRDFYGDRPAPGAAAQPAGFHGPMTYQQGKFSGFLSTEQPARQYQPANTADTASTLQLQHRQLQYQHHQQQPESHQQGQLGVDDWFGGPYLGSGGHYSAAVLQHGHPETGPPARQEHPEIGVPEARKTGPLAKRKHPQTDPPAANELPDPFDEFVIEQPETPEDSPPAES